MRRFLSLLLTGSLIFSSSIQASALMPAAAGSTIGGLLPPLELGILSDRFVGRSNRKVILIQDLHAHLDTQRKIAGLLGFYDQKGIQGPIAIEGTSGVWDLSLLEQYPVRAQRQAFFDYLLQEAALTGPESYVLGTHQPRRLFGVDSAADAMADRKSTRLNSSHRL